MIVPLLSLPRSLRKPWETRKVPLTFVSYFPHLISFPLPLISLGGTYKIQPPLIRIYIRDRPRIKRTSVINQHIRLPKPLLHSLPERSNGFGISNIGNRCDDFDIFVDCQNLLAHFVERCLLAGCYDNGFGSCFSEGLCETLGFR